MLKVIAACGSGMGSSQLIKMKLEKVFKNLGIEASIYHTNVGDAKSQANNYDVKFYKRVHLQKGYFLYRNA